MSQIRLEELCVGSRILIRAKSDWRNASIRSILDEKIILNVISPSGRAYLLRRRPAAEIEFLGNIAVLRTEESDDWRENLCKQDARW
jgi:hypothetical protein